MNVSSVGVVAAAAYEPSEAAISTTNATAAMAGVADHRDREASVPTAVVTVPTHAMTR